MNYCVVASIDTSTGFAQVCNEKLSELDDFLTECEVEKTLSDDSEPVQCFTEWCNKTNSTTSIDEFKQQLSQINVSNLVYTARVNDIELFIVE